MPRGVRRTMLKFKSVTLSDKPWVDSIVLSENSPSADYNFGNIYIWDKYFRQLITRFEDRMITKLRYEGKPAFVFPVGTGPLKPAVEAIREFCDFRGYPMVLRGITEIHREELEKEYPGSFEFEEDVSCADYVYDIDALSTYSGKDLHGKRNHCNRFEAEHSWEFLPLTREIIPKCMDMLAVWTEENIGRLDESIVHEHDAIVRAFAAYECLNLEGGVLMADGHIMGFTVGEVISRDTFNTHFEKAESNVNGAYTMVCRELARMVKRKHPEIKYINREDDMGIESLRISKKSYKPKFMVRKYTGRIIT